MILTYMQIPCIFPYINRFFMLHSSSIFRSSRLIFMIFLILKSSFWPLKFHKTSKLMITVWHSNNIRSWIHWTTLPWPRPFKDTINNWNLTKLILRFRRNSFPEAIHSTKRVRPTCSVKQVFSNNWWRKSSILFSWHQPFFLPPL